MNQVRRLQAAQAVSHEQRVKNGLQMWQKEVPHLDSSGKAICGRIVALAGIMHQRYNDALSEFDLKYPEYGVLATLRASGAPYRMTQSQLMETILFSSGGMSNLLARLERKGLIVRQDDQDDRRITHVSLSQVGIHTAGQAMAVQSLTENNLCASLDENERATLISSLGKLLTGTP